MTPSTGTRSGAIRRPGRRCRDAGSMSVEMTALVFPVTLVMTVLILATWQLTAAKLDVNTAAAAAARAASLQTSPADAEDAARQAAAAAMADAGRTCTSLTVAVETSEFTHGGFVEVRLVCHARTGDLLGLAAPGSVDLSAASRAPIERFRELHPELSP
jgi:Flp pilus assembly protein TadG